MMHMIFTRGVRKTPGQWASASVAAGGCFGIVVFACLLFGGCQTNETCPLVPVASMELKPDRASAVQIPSSSFVFDTTIDSFYARTLSPRQFSLPEYRLALVTRPPAAQVDSIRVVQKKLSSSPSPYTSGKYPLIHRVIVGTKSGKYFYTHTFGKSAGRTTVPGKYMFLDALSFNSPDGDFGPDGILKTKPIPPMQVITSGYTATIAVKGSNIGEMLVVPPSLTGLSSLGFSGDDGSYGSDGSDGDSGSWGDSGADGRWPGSWRGKVLRGSGGRNGGHGKAGENGRDGRNGDNGDNAGTVRVSVVPVSSPFFRQPLQAISITSTIGKSRTVILPWGAKLAINARGGDGGNGGDGGDGGDGGGGGDGGDGGGGSHGANGLRGKDGGRGAPGRNATKTSRGGKGGRGGAGGPGGSGTDGGSGGNGGNGGNGAAGGNGGDGADGGNGARGADVIVTVQGTDRFAEMVKVSLALDVRGGDAGSGGDGGEGGEGGRAGEGGDAGDRGEGGSGGSGGRGGPGGPGGRELRWVQKVTTKTGDGPHQSYTYDKQMRSPGGPDGDRGPDGPDGRPGKDGSRGRGGQNGTAGTGGQDGSRGEDGHDGRDGTVKYVVRGPIKYAVSSDVRAVNVATGEVVGTASAQGTSDDLKRVADGLVAGMLRKGSLERNSTVAVVTMHNRSRTLAGQVVAEELADKVNGRLRQTRQFVMAERIDLSAIFNEKDLAIALGKGAITLPPDAKAKLKGVRYLILGSTTTSEIVRERDRGR